MSAWSKVREIPAPPLRPTQSHKGSLGRVLIVAGSRGMAGAAALAGMGALRGGAGLVTVAVPDCIVDLVSGFEPGLIVKPLPCDASGKVASMAWDVLADSWDHYDAVACGPGWGRSHELDDLAGRLLRWCPLPLVIDADALNALAVHGESWVVDADRPPRILTPHPGEFARLLHSDVATVQSAREDLAAQFAQEKQLVVLLKGVGSVITDGQRLAINSSGNNGLATAGTGDVLTGLTVALLAQGLEAFAAAYLAAFVHGRAGELAAAELSRPGLLASDLPRYIALAWRAMGQ